MTLIGIEKEYLYILETINEIAKRQNGDRVLNAEARIVTITRRRRQNNWSRKEKHHYPMESSCRESRAWVNWQLSTDTRNTRNTKRTHKCH